ncbi:MAG: insulinase family protein [Bacteroidales bacterium]|nr:insulinase family protein [Bacteroidales bacterium]
MNLIKLSAFLSVFLLTISGSSQDKFDFNIGDIDIKYEKFTLDNGLTLLVHEDHKAPIVALNIWYHVGSKNEKAGKTGFAHLFEHLMFNGSENYDTDYFQAIESIGATDVNGTTNFDRTNYFENVPLSAFDIALFMESDRMGHFEGAISQEKLDEQRGVVQNEKRQGENQPYGQFMNLVTKNCFPAAHPYYHTVIGEMEDLNAASLDDVKEWFTNYYGPANAVIVIAGDVKTSEVYNKIVAYFGDIPSGPPVTHPKVWIAKRTGETRVVQQDRVPQTQVSMIWNVPEWGNPDAIRLGIVASVLSDGKSSRLYKRLVYDEQIASGVYAYNWENEIAGLFVIQADVKPGVDSKVVESAINEELERLIKQGPTQAEIDRAKVSYFAGFVRGMERIGGFGGKSDILAQNTVYKGNPDYYKTRLATIKEANTTSVQTAAKDWLSDGKFYLEIVPFPEYSIIESDIDRSSGLPEMGKTTGVKFPDIQKKTLSNGMQIILAERHDVPLVKFSLQLDAGYAADQFAVPGTADLAMNMLDEGTDSRDAIQISEEKDMLGAVIYSGSNLDMSFVNLSALKATLDKSLDLYADIILHPSFPEKEFLRLQKQQIVGIQQEKANPIQMALRVFPKFLYGDGHAYSNPFTGSGFEKGIADMTTADLQKFYDTWFKPNNATMVVVGDISMDELAGKLEARFKKWKSGKIPEKNLATVDFPAQNKVYILDRPGAVQSVIIAGFITEPYGKGNEPAISMMNNILGGEFTSRLNMNLREDKGWAYGASTILIGARGQRPFIAYAPVQSDKTSESMAEIKKELADFLGDRPPTEEEFEKTKENEVLSLPGKWETLSAVQGSLLSVVRYGLPDDYFQKYADVVRKLKMNDVATAAKSIVHPAHINWIVVGDRAAIEEKIKALGFGDVVVIDADGNVVE